MHIWQVFLSLLYFLKEQKRLVNSLCHMFIFSFETRQTFFKVYMNILALEATLCFYGIFAKQLCKATINFNHTYLYVHVE
jgi:hypothetical protein